jgi:tetratricopeptide (TPR) repeat protein
MYRSLAQRFHSGNSEWANPFTLQAGRVDETPRSEMEIIRSARQQIDVQNAVGREIAGSNVVGAQIITNEIEEQTQALNKSTNEIGERISESIILAADQISDAIDMLGDRLCLELSEIKWQLAQRNKTMEEILEVLNQSRNNEARQLVQQGLRHYINAEFEEAEERFKLALSFDTTDYQVLMNLAFIEIHKENTKQALIYLKKALSLPETLDAVSIARTLWVTARLYYTEMDYKKAYAYAQKAFKNDRQNDPGVFYDLGVYAALAGEKSVALEKIERSILIDSSYFSKCSVDQDLNTIKQDILQLLGRLSVDAECEAKQIIEQVKSDLALLKTEGEFNSKDDYIGEARRIINNAIDGLQKPSYSFCRHCTNVMNKIQEILSQIRSMIPLYSKVERSQEIINRMKEVYSSIKRQPEMVREIFPAFYAILFFISYLLPGYLFANAGIAESGTLWFLLFVFWPFWIALDFLSKDFSSTGMALVMSSVLFTVVVMWGMVSLFRKIKKQKYDRMNRELSRIDSQFLNTERTLICIQNEITSRHNNIREELAKVTL